PIDRIAAARGSDGSGAFLGRNCCGHSREASYFRRSGAVNSPDQCVISGATNDVKVLCTVFAELGIECQQLLVSHAFHSPLLEPILDEFEQVCKSLRWRQPTLRLISNVTGSVATSDMLSKSAYWRRQVREPVQFAEAARSLAKLRPDICIEIGPSPALLP